MKTRKLKILASLGALLLSSGSIFAGPPVADHSKDKTPIQPLPEICGPWFAGFNAGVWWVEDYGTNVPFAPGVGDHDVSFETGFGINATPIGYRVCEMFAVSLETGFYQADVDSVTLPAGGGLFTATDGQLRLFPVMVNGTLTFPVSDRLTLYAGVGVGAVYRELEATVPLVALLGSFHDSGWDCMVQARAGLAFEIADCTFLNVGYRYNHVFTSPDDIAGHMVEAGITFMWH
ncbi:MAG: porin family protein [Prosthecobacter sp.]|nr:porin family protein [Prosthecobacter sp.]